MNQVNLQTIKDVWKYKLTKKFGEEELFNVYVDSPFCFAPKCAFCIYKPTIIQNTQDSQRKDVYYEKILIQNICDFEEVLRLRDPNAIYFGGGTSSLATTTQLENIFKTFQNLFDFMNVTEKHFEFNPLSATDDKIQLLLDWKFTHFTFGFQTFNRQVLKFNQRVNVSLDRMKEITEKLEQANIKYNIDIMSFIFNDSLEEDMTILSDDLQILGKVLKPKRITVFPNYKKFNNLFAPQNRDVYINKIRRFRETVNAAANKYKYRNIHKASEKTDDKSILRYPLANPMLLREDVAQETWKSYSSTAPWNNPPKNQNVLAIGGFGERKPYSYIPNKFCYITKNTETERSFELVFSDITYES